MAKKKSIKKISKKQTKGLISLAIVILVILAGLYIFNESEIYTKEVYDEMNFNYIGYNIENADYLSDNCHVIRVGRCDTLDLEGEVFGRTCWFRDVELEYDLINLQKGITCDITDEEQVTLGEDLEFSKSGETYKLTVNVDIRQNNDLTACCTREETEVCLEPVKVEAIC
jgi:hypothetical protein